MQSSEQKISGSLLGGTLLISGSCIGAGMLGLPVLSALAGLKPSMLTLFLAWLFMLATGLLMLEVSLWFKDEVSIISMANRTLGVLGKIVGWAGFLFLFYALLVAYIAGSGTLFSNFIQTLTGYELPPWIGSFLLTLLFTFFLYMGTKTVDYFNRGMIAGLIVSYVLLVSLGLPHIKPARLLHSDWNAAFLAFPTMIISFGYHNLIPSLKTYLNHNVKKLRSAVIIGSALPFFIYALWEILILGLIPLEGEGGFREAFSQGDLATQLLSGAVGSSWVVSLAHYFAFFAIVTSFLGVGLSFVDFLADGLQIKKTPIGKIGLCLAVSAPPFLCAMIYPKIFLMALNYAGAFGTVILFGILPVAMTWSGRYHKKLNGVRLLPGGKGLLIAVTLFALGIICLQIIFDTVT